MICEGIKSLLQKRGGWNVVFCAASSGETLELLDKSNLPDGRILCALVDISLGSENGLELAKELSLRGIRCIIYSMFKSPSYVLKAMDIGAYGYVLKEQSEQELMQALDSASKGQKFMSYELMDSANTLLRIMSCFTKKERDVFELVIEDKSVDEIAELLNMKKRTVENHLSFIYTKTNCSSREELRKKFA